jgi:chromatin remodeling complex protein RSC6
MSETESKQNETTVSEPEVPKVDEVSDENTFNTKITDMTSRVETICKELKTVCVEMKTLKKEHTKTLKKMAVLEKSKGGRRKKSQKDKAPVDPNAEKKGFDKPVKISLELSRFLELADDIEIARPEVTHLLSVYIKKHDLQSKEDGRNIDLTKPNGEELAKILAVERDVKVDYFKMQTHLTHHYPISKKRLKAIEKEEAVAAALAAGGDAPVVPEVAAPVKAVKAVAAKAVAAPVVETSAPVEDVKPKRRRRVEETVPASV